VLRTNFHIVEHINLHTVYDELNYIKNYSARSLGRIQRYILFTFYGVVIMFLFVTLTSKNKLKSIIFWDIGLNGYTASYPRT
jgi:hypothetical protein